MGWGFGEAAIEGGNGMGYRVGEVGGRDGLVLRLGRGVGA